MIVDVERLVMLETVRDALDVLEMCETPNIDLAREAIVRLYVAAGLTGAEVRSRLPLLQASGKDRIDRMFADGAA